MTCATPGIMPGVMNGATPGESPTVEYLVLQDCRVGYLRRAGETFEWPAINPCPSYLQLVDASEETPEAEESASAPKRRKRNNPEGATLEEMGLGPALPAEKVQSVDVIIRSRNKE